MKKVLVAIDTNEISEKILIKGHGLAVATGGACAVVSVIPPIVYLPDGGMPMPLLSPAEMYEQSEEAAIKFINEIVSRNNITISEIIVKQGEPAEEIVATAAETESDTIVIGTHGRTGLDHILVGSVAEHVIRHSPVPVFVIPRKFID